MYTLGGGEGQILFDREERYGRGSTRRTVHRTRREAAGTSPVHDTPRTKTWRKLRLHVVYHEHPMDDGGPRHHRDPWSPPFLRCHDRVHDACDRGPDP